MSMSNEQKSNEQQLSFTDSIMSVYKKKISNKWEWSDIRSEIEGLIESYDKKTDPQLKEINDLKKQVKIAEGKLKGIPKLNEKIKTLQETNEKMSETLDFYLIQAGSKMANDED